MSRAAKSRRRNPVTRQMLVDPNFHADIVSADVGIVGFLGRDFEVSMYAVTPSVKRMWGSTDDHTLGPGKIESDLVHRETARIRMGPATVAHLALNLAMTLRQYEPESFEHLITQMRKYAGGDLDVVVEDADGHENDSSTFPDETETMHPAVDDRDPDSNR